MIFRSLWTNGFVQDSALSDCRSGLFDGLEGPVPANTVERNLFGRKLNDTGAAFIAEIVTGGGYVPDFAATMEKHIDDFREKAEAALECSPLFLTVLAGSDAWPVAQNVDFFGKLLEITGKLGIGASFETHRSRPTFNPWNTRDLLLQLPLMRITCDFSHWCCVCERLVLDDEPEILTLCAERAQHIHARVGYAQGPQVPHPAAPEYKPELEAHERWWDAIWNVHQKDCHAITTMTPESGPDGYLQHLPFGGGPVANLDEINSWMASRQRDRFDKRVFPAAV
jgi:hypothetical protein